MLLAFDTATSRVSVAMHDGERVVAAVDSEASMRHGEHLAPTIQRVLAQAGASMGDVSQIAVGVGPGPFTGLRVGLVTARTLGLTRGVEVLGVCTLDVLAAEAIDRGLEDFVVATDARRKEVYVASYAYGRRSAGPFVQRPDDAATDTPAVGQGALLYPDAFRNPMSPAYPSAAVLADVVVRHRHPSGPPEPMYLRRPDVAEPHARKPVS